MPTWVCILHSRIMLPLGFGRWPVLLEDRLAPPAGHVVRLVTTLLSVPS